MSNSIVQVREPVNEVGAGRTHRARPSGRRSSAARRDARRADRDPADHRRRGGAHRQHRRARLPHDHGHVLADFHQAGAAEVERRSRLAGRRGRSWSEMAWEDRAAVFLKAADLLAGPWRDTVNAATMLNQSKTVYQAEIDCGLRADRLLALQRLLHAPDLHRAAGLGCRHLEPRRVPRPRGLRLRRDAVQLHLDRRQPADRAGDHGQRRAVEAGVDGGAVGYYIMRLLEEAGLPAGVINFVPGRGGRSGTRCWPARTGRHPLHRLDRSSRACGRRSASNIAPTRPTRASSARPAARTSSSPTLGRRPALVTALVRGAFEYQGQKCSAASRAYVPRVLWPAVSEASSEQLGRVEMGPPTDFRNFMCAVIDEPRSTTSSAYIEQRRGRADCEIVRWRSTSRSATSSSRR